MGKTTYDSKEFKSHNKSDKPDNIVKKENDIYIECENIQKELPSFMRSFFSYLKGNVLPMTRLAYLHDIKFFMNYLINETDLTEAKETKDITSDELKDLSFGSVFGWDTQREYNALESLSDKGLIRMNRQLMPYTVLKLAESEDLSGKLYNELC